MDEPPFEERVTFLFQGNVYPTLEEALLAQKEHLVGEWLKTKMGEIFPSYVAKTLVSHSEELVDILRPQ